MKKLIFSIIGIVALSCNQQLENTQNLTAIDDLLDTDCIVQDTTLAENNNLGNTIQQENSPKIARNKKVNNLSLTKEELFRDLNHQFKKPPQSFLFNSNDTIEFTCKEGTKINIPPNSFLTNTNKSVEGQIRIDITEYYKYADILSANLTTYSNNKMLETGGMIHIEVLADNQTCHLKNNCFLSISFPTLNQKENMLPFKGEWISNEINWTLDSTAISKVSIAKKEYLVQYVDESPQYPGGLSEFYRFLDLNIEYPQDAVNSNFEGTVYTSLKVNINGELSDFKILKGEHKTLNDAALLCLRKLPNLIPAKLNGEDVNSTMTIPIKFNLSGSNNSIASTKFNYSIDKHTNSIKTEKELNATSIKNISYYIISSSNLGWINCDRFYGDENPKINYNVKLANSDIVEMKIIFKDIRSVLPGFQQGNGYTFNNIPTNKQITIFALKKVNQQLYIAIKETSTSIEFLNDLVFEPVNYEEFKRKIEKLN